MPSIPFFQQTTSGRAFPFSKRNTSPTSHSHNTGCTSLLKLDSTLPQSTQRLYLHHAATVLVFGLPHSDLPASSYLKERIQCFLSHFV